MSHSLVRAHPGTGDRSLYLDSTTTVGIDYMDTASGLALLDEVYESATSDEFVPTNAPAPISVLCLLIPS